MYFDYHAVAGILHTAIPLAAGAAGVGYFVARAKGVGFASGHLLVGLPMFVVGAAAAYFFYLTSGDPSYSF
ncbi:hypothetical protein [Prochlorococcus sp. MIT 1300]|uniref:hypothetical protein n=1 Tax=Prochlorococcus sp. MIT 1300 TaxID=3096218 RepID=UPI002A7564CC|nr:hypothetical protein [Prochlorococcus sp. MIT 1300]